MPGPWEKYGGGGAGTQGVPIGLQDPTMPYKATGAALDNEGKRANINNDAERIAIERERLRVAQQAAARADQAAASAAGISQRERDGKLGGLRALESQIGRVRDLYKQGPGATSGIASVMDYAPTEANAAFDTAAAGLSEMGLSAFRVPGVGSQSDAELKAFIAANRPSASDFDVSIEEKLRNLETRLTEAYKPYGVQYGGAKQAPAPPRKAGSKANTTWYGTPRSAPRKGAQSRVIDFNDLPE